MIVCKECKKLYNDEIHLSKHLARKPEGHISLKEYYDKYYLKNEQDKKCHYRNCSNVTSFENIISGTVARIF